MLIEQIKLESDEQLIQIVRKHKFMLVLYITSDVILALLPLVAFFFGYAVLKTITTDTFDISLLVGQYTHELWFFYLAWVVMIWMHFTNHMTDYYLDLWAITDRRIVAIDQRGFFDRFLSSFRLERLQDMNIEVKGILPTLLNFGTIEAQTAGGNHEEFKARNMPDPRGLKALITNLADKRQRITHNYQDIL